MAAITDAPNTVIAFIHATAEAAQEWLALIEVGRFPTRETEHR